MVTKELFERPFTTIKAVGSKNSDIIKLMEFLLPYAVEQTSKAAFALKMAKKTSLLDIWEFARNSAVYKQDSNFTQVVKSPNALIHAGAGDCKSFSLLCYGLAKNLGYTPNLRFVSYEKGRKTPSHVYCMVCNTAIDATINEFKELPYSHKMDIFGIYGIGKKKKGTAKKVAGAPLRAAFNSLLLINFRGIATKLDQLAKRGTKVKSLWEKFGGKYSELLEKINKAKGKKPFLGGGKKKGIGAEPVTLATVTALITAALPLLTATSALFKTEGLAENGEMSLDTSSLDVPMEEATKAQTTAKEVLTGETEPTTEEKSTLPMPLIIGGALALVLLMKKK